MDDVREYSLAEVMEKGFEADHGAEDGVWRLFHGCWAMRSDPRGRDADAGHRPRASP